jgi:DNA-binding response OmpR family regulator
MRILIVEDDTTIATNLYDFLESRGYTVDAAADGITALHLAVTHEFDAILLDLNLPGVDGLTVCRKLREEAAKDTPVIMLTARDTVDEKLRGFASGADDYVVKPFSLREIEARLAALQKRRSGRMALDEITAGDLRFDRRGLAVSFCGRPVKLPPKCLKLLERLMSDPERVFSRVELELAAWGEPQETSDALRSQMHILRRALTTVGGYDPIENVHGLGYRVTGRP